ncbi:hypothetical protein TNCV_3724041 [Trichonephila clavipes]|nr:hypothetical protein TNCV_3724041 [Trichonephila clavipes]
MLLPSTAGCSMSQTTFAEPERKKSSESTRFYSCAQYNHHNSNEWNKQPIFEEEILALCGKDIDKVEIPMDKASSHKSKSTAAYLAKKESEA